jgi:TfoX/Sxy family transcriptional regulator of competence genes
MASKQQNVDFILEQLADLRATARKMFGEFAIYVGPKLVALFCDDELFIKPTPEGKTHIGKVVERPPYPGAKPYYFVSGDRCEDSEWLTELVRVTERALPLPPPKKPKTAAKSVKSSTKKKPVKRR